MHNIRGDMKSLKWNEQAYNVIKTFSCIHTDSCR